MTADRLEELASLARLAELLAIEAAGDAPARLHAMARALAVRLATIANGVRIATPFWPRPGPVQVAG